MKIKTKLRQETGKPASVQEYNRHMTELKERWGSSTLPPIQEENKDKLHKNIQKNDKCHTPNVMIICTENFIRNENWQPEV